MATYAFKRIKRFWQDKDKVLAVTVLILLVLTATVPSQAWRSINFTAIELWNIAPFLLLSVGIAAYLGLAE